jgi:hypothetical protein
MLTTTSTGHQQVRNAPSLNRNFPLQRQSEPSPDPAPRITAIPAQFTSLEPVEPEKFINDDPVFNTADAAAILGVNADRMVKWRYRKQGPAYLRYEGNGHVRYELSELIRFKAAHRVRPSRQPRIGRGASR